MEASEIVGMQGEVVVRVCSLVDQQEPAEYALLPRAALLELLRGRDLYMESRAQQSGCRNSKPTAQRVRNPNHPNPTAYPNPTTPP